MKAWSVILLIAGLWGAGCAGLSPVDEAQSQVKRAKSDLNATQYDLDTAQLSFDMLPKDSPSTLDLGRKITMTQRQLTAKLSGLTVAEMRLAALQKPNGTTPKPPETVTKPTPPPVLPDPTPVPTVPTPPSIGTTPPSIGTTPVPTVPTPVPTVPTPVPTVPTPAPAVGPDGLPLPVTPTIPKPPVPTVPTPPSIGTTPPSIGTTPPSIGTTPVPALPKFQDLQLVSYKLETDPGTGFVLVLGDLQNTAAGLGYTDVKVAFRFLDAAGKELGTATDEVNMLKGAAVWSFKVLAPDGAVKAELVDISGVKQ